MDIPIFFNSDTDTVEMPRTRQQTTLPEVENVDSFEVSLVETDYGEYTIAEINFNALMEKMDRVLDKLTTIMETVGNIFSFISTQRNIQTGAVTPITTNVGQSTESNENQTTILELCDNIRELIQETNQPAWEREARRIKRIIENIWYKKLNDRRKQYWLKLRNENLSKVYEAWRDQTLIILPQQVQMHNIHGKPDDHRRRRERQVLDNFKSERDLLDLKAQSHEEKYRSIDEEIISIISEKSVGMCKNILISMWNDVIKREEGVSLDRWKSKNLLWLKKYESDFRTKYADKNPFIKETETEINMQTYPQRRPGRNKSPQGRNLNNPDKPQRREQNNGYRPRNNFTIPQERPLYSEIVQQQRQQQPERNPQAGYQDRGEKHYIHIRTTL